MKKVVKPKGGISAPRPESKWSLERPECRWKNNNKIIHRQIQYQSSLVWYLVVWIYNNVIQIVSKESGTIQEFILIICLIR